MPINTYEAQAFATKILTLVSSGMVAGTISCALRDRNETIISSVVATSSGNGFYYALVQHPGSACWVVNEWTVVVNANTYVSRQFGKVITLEVD